MRTSVQPLIVALCVALAISVPARAEEAEEVAGDAGGDLFGTTSSTVEGFVRGKAKADVEEEENEKMDVEKRGDSGSSPISTSEYMQEQTAYIALLEQKLSQAVSRLEQMSSACEHRLRLSSQQLQADLDKQKTVAANATDRAQKLDSNLNKEISYNHDLMGKLKQVESKLKLKEGEVASQKSKIAQMDKEQKSEMTKMIDRQKQELASMRRMGMALNVEDENRIFTNVGATCQQCEDLGFTNPMDCSCVTETVTVGTEQTVRGLAIVPFPYVLANGFIAVTPDQTHSPANPPTAYPTGAAPTDYPTAVAPTDYPTGVAPTEYPTEAAPPDFGLTTSQPTDAAEWNPGGTEENNAESSSPTTQEESLQGVQGDPFTVFRGKQTQFYLPLGESTLLMTCTSHNYPTVELKGEAFNISPKDTQQWFKAFTIIVGNRELIQVRRREFQELMAERLPQHIGALAAAAKARSAAASLLADVAATEALSGDSKVSMAQVVEQRVAVGLQALHWTESASANFKKGFQQQYEHPLSSMNVTIDGRDVTSTGADSLPLMRHGGSDGQEAYIALTQDQSAHIGNGWSETMAIGVGNVGVEFTTAIAQKYESKTLQATMSHLDMRFTHLNVSECSGPLPEIWGQVPMSKQTARMLMPPQ